MQKITTQSILISDTTASPGITLSLQSTGLLLATLVSGSILIGIAIRLVTNFQNMATSIRDLKEDLNTHINSEGHVKILDEVKTLRGNLIDFDKRFAVHCQDYVNYKDGNILAYNGVREAIGHKWQRTEDELHGVKASIKDLESFLQKRDDFKIRE